MYNLDRMVHTVASCIATFHDFIADRNLIMSYMPDSSDGSHHTIWMYSFSSYYYPTRALALQNGRISTLRVTSTAHTSASSQRRKALSKVLPMPLWSQKS